MREGPPVATGVSSIPATRQPRRRLNALVGGVSAAALALGLVACDEKATNNQANEARQVGNPLPDSYYQLPKEPEKGPAVLSIAPTRFDFPPTAPGATAQATFTVTNSGEQAATLMAAAISGGPFSLAADQCAGHTIEPRASCVVSVRYAPVSDAPAMGTLTVPSNAPGGPISATLAGAVPPPVHEAPPIGPSPEELEAAERARIAMDRIEERRALGPKLKTRPTPTPGVRPTRWTMRDENYEELGVPTRTSSFPVNQSFTITPFRVIRGILMKPIDTSHPGDVTVMIDEDVLSPDGHYRLLERGDLALARYKQPKKQGDTRVYLEFYRVERTADHATVYAAGPGDHFAYATDAMGRVGVAGVVYHRTWEKLETAVLMAGLSAGPPVLTSIAAPDNENLQNAFNQWGTQLGAVGAEDVKSKIDLLPIIQVASGEYIHIQLKDDIAIRRPEPEKPKEGK